MKQVLKYLLCVCCVLVCIGCSKDKASLHKKELQVKKIAYFDGMEDAVSLACMEEFEEVRDVYEVECFVGETSLEECKEATQSGLYDLIFVRNLDVDEIVKLNPSQLFVVFEQKLDYDNVLCIQYNQEQMGYLVGSFASSLTHAKRVDRINPKRMLGVIGENDAYLFGYLKAVSDYGMHTSVVLDDFKQMVEQDVDLVWCMNEEENASVGESCLLDTNCWMIGTGYGLEEVLQEEVSRVTIASIEKDIPGTMMYVLKEWSHDRLRFGRSVTYGIEEGFIRFGMKEQYDHFVDQDTKDYVQSVMEEIKVGKVKVVSLKDVNALQQFEVLKEKVTV